MVEEEEPYAAFEGRKGAQLQIFSTADGTLLKHYPLAAPPVFDGMATAHGRLYITDQADRISCFVPPKE